MDLLYPVVRLINIVVVLPFNGVAKEFFPFEVQLPQLTVALAANVLLFYLAYWIFSNRQLLFGGWRARISVDIPAEATVGWTPGKILENPSIKIADKPDSIRLFDPCTGAVLGEGEVRVSSAADVAAAVSSARAAQNQWVKTTFAQRGEVLKVLNDYIVEHQEEICRVASRDTGTAYILILNMGPGKTMVDGAFGEVLTTCEKITWTLAHGEKALAPEYRSVGMLTIHKTARVEYQPMGVLGAIIPWNYPFHNMLGQVISAIYSGNALVLKVSEHSVWSSQFYLKIVQKALAQCGHSPDLVQVVNGYGPVGSALIPLVDKLTFIGSPGVGKLVMKTAAETLTPVVLELGGKDAAIICDDADIKQVINLAMRGTFQNCGQNCIGLERLVVHADVYDDFVKRVEGLVNDLSQGPPLEGDVDCGAMTMGPGEIDRILTLVDQAVKSGARLLAGGRRNEALPSGSFMEPTLLVDVTPDMDIARNEVFGPVMTVLRAKDDADAVSIVNSTKYGLGGSVFSLDYNRAGSIAARLRTGMCNLNDFGVNYLCQSLPFGGVGISGFDRFAGVEGIRGCCNLRAVTSDKFTGIRTDIPPPLQYPISKSGFTFVSALISMFYGDGILPRLAAIGKLLAASFQGKRKRI